VFPKHSGCLQLECYTRTVGSHRGADIVLQSAGGADRRAALGFSISDSSFTLQDFSCPQGTFVSRCQVRVRPGHILSSGSVLLGGAWGCPGKGGWVLLPRERFPGWGSPGKGAQQSWVGAAAQGRLQEQELA
ncbi:FHAD1 protein, partial [Nesospiza acunhae]|nr:FHAD1 protein [Nesospiza acunhae]